MGNYYIAHSEGQKTGGRSKYKGGFVNGKNTSAYNHDYYIHNKSKWRGRTGLKRTAREQADSLQRLTRTSDDAASRALARGDLEAFNYYQRQGDELNRESWNAMRDADARRNHTGKYAPAAVPEKTWRQKASDVASNAVNSGKSAVSNLWNKAKGGGVSWEFGEPRLENKKK